VRVLEAYAGEQAHHAHLQTPRFQKFRVGSGPLLVGERRLLEALPVVLGARLQATALAPAQMRRLNTSTTNVK
jgi:hypothetical protein